MQIRALFFLIKYALKTTIQKCSLAIHNKRLKMLLGMDKLKANYAIIKLGEKGQHDESC